MLFGNLLNYIFIPPVGGAGSCQDVTVSGLEHLFCSDFFFLHSRNASFWEGIGVSSQRYLLFLCKDVFHMWTVSKVVTEFVATWLVG